MFPASSAVKKTLLALCLAGGLCSGAAPATAPAFSAEVKETLYRYESLHVCMYELLITLHGIQDATEAAARAASVKAQLQRIKEMTTDLDDPYQAIGNTGSKAARQAISHRRMLMQEPGLLLEQEIIRLAKAKYYGSASLIQAFQSVGILDSRADAFASQP